MVAIDTEQLVSLVALATERGIELDDAAASYLLATRGAAAAEDLVAGAGALIDLAGALGQELDQAAAFRRMDAVGGDYDRAAASILEPFLRRRQHAFDRGWHDAERRYYGEDAKARHAVFVGHLAGGSLGWQASMLLRAAGDAGLTAPGETELRAQLVRIVGDEIERRYPVRQEAPWVVISEDNATHVDLVRAEIRREQQARDLVLGRRPELAQRIDALRSARLVRDINRVLDGVRKRLAARAEHGWIADPERYEREVIQAAAEAARQAS